jgi:type IV pilus assembly protein PilP
MMTMALPLLTLTLSAFLAQVPDPTPAINAAKNAKAKVEAAQQKNAEALDQKPAPATPPPAGAPAPAAPAASAPPSAGAQGAPSGAGYSYDPAGRRDPFVSLTARGGDLPPAGSRPSGPAGLLVNEITLKGVLKSPKGLIALVQAPDNRTYIMHAGDKVFDGTVKAITQDALVFSQDVNDPLSLVKQREVRKAIRPEAR